MPYCSSCGSYIPEGQGSSCSMCYGDIAYGKDGYYEEWALQQSMQEQDAIDKAEYDKYLDSLKDETLNK